LDCGGGRAPPKLNVPGCAAYTGTATYSPSFMAGFTAGAKVGGAVDRNNAMAVGGSGSVGGSLGGGVGFGIGAGAAMTASATPTSAAVANEGNGNGNGNGNGDGSNDDQSTIVSAAPTTSTTQAVGPDQGSMTLGSAIGTSRPVSTSQATASPSSTGSASGKTTTGLTTSTGNSSIGSVVPTGSMSMSRSLVKTVPTFTTRPVADGADERGKSVASTSASLVASTGAAVRNGVFGGVSVVAAILGALVIM
jgi:hypothetical protein